MYYFILKGIGLILIFVDTDVNGVVYVATVLKYLRSPFGEDWYRPVPLSPLTGTHHIRKMSLVLLITQRTVKLLNCCEKIILYMIHKFVQKSCQRRAMLDNKSSS